MENKLKSEIWFEFSCSSGPGGQNVNRNQTRVTACFIPQQSKLLSEYQKKLLRGRLLSKINKDGILRVSSGKFRTQNANKKQAYENMLEVITAALKTTPKRRKTKATRSSQLRRLDEKRKRSEIKKIRQSKDY